MVKGHRGEECELLSLFASSYQYLRLESAIWLDFGSSSEHLRDHWHFSFNGRPYFILGSPWIIWSCQCQLLVSSRASVKQRLPCLGCIDFVESETSPATPTILACRVVRLKQVRERTASHNRRRPVLKHLQPVFSIFVKKCD